LGALLLVVTAEAALAAWSGVKSIALQPALSFIYCIARGVTYSRAHGIRLALRHGLLFVATGLAANLVAVGMGFVLAVGTALVQVAAGRDWDTIFSKTPAFPDFPIVPYLSALLAMLIGICLSSAFVISSRKWAVAGHLGCPCCWCLLVWPELAIDVVTRDVPSNLGFSAIVYSGAIAYWVGGLLGMRHQPLVNDAGGR
jgi:hypothetical protein